jgi:hypothetical protein
MMRRIACTLTIHGSSLDLDFNGQSDECIKRGDVLRVEPAQSVHSLLSDACEFPITEVSEDAWRFGSAENGPRRHANPHCRTIVTAHNAVVRPVVDPQSETVPRGLFEYDLPNGRQWALSANCATTPIQAVVSACGPASFDTLWPTLFAAYLSDSGARAYAQAAFGLLTDGIDGFALPPHLPLFHDPADLESRRIQLTVRVNSRSLWPMSIPLDHFQKYDGYGRFSYYSGIEWILTDKTFCRTRWNGSPFNTSLQIPSRRSPRRLHHQRLRQVSCAHFTREPIGKRWDQARKSRGRALVHDSRAA